VTCKLLSALSTLPNVQVDRPGSGAIDGVSEISAWISVETDGKNPSMNVSTTSIFVWESAIVGASGLSKSLKASNGGGSRWQDDPGGILRTHLGLAYSQTGRHDAAQEEFLVASAPPFSSASAARWLKAHLVGLELKRSHLDVDFVEIGCSMFQTITMSLPGGSMARGLAVEPVPRYLAEMMGAASTASEGGGLPRVHGLGVAVDAGSNVRPEPHNVENLYYLAAEDVIHWVLGYVEPTVEVPNEKSIQPFLSADIFGCNSLGGPHKSVDSFFQEKGLVAPWKIEPVPVFTYQKVLEWWNRLNHRSSVEGVAVGVLKIDTEGKDLAIVGDVLQNCLSGQLSRKEHRILKQCPLAIQIEYNDHFYTSNDSEGFLRQFEQAGYTLAHRDGSDLYFSWNQAYFETNQETMNDSKDRRAQFNTSAFAWSAPLGLVVEGMGVCGSQELSNTPDATPLAAGIPSLVCLLNTGTNLPSLSFPVSNR